MRSYPDAAAAARVHAIGPCGMPSVARPAQQQWALRPTLIAQVLYSFPSAMPSDLGQGLAAFCFPHGVRPELLERTPSMSGG